MKNKLLVAAAVSVILASCASVPKSPDGSVALRSKLTALQADASLAKLSPVAIQEAEAAVKLAETPQDDPKVTAHLVYMADHKIDTARALAETKLAEEQRTALKEQNESSRLQARTREADAANAAAATAKLDADNSRADANAARETAATNEASAASQAKLSELQHQIDLLQAKTTERGIVLTLGDVLFENGKSDLRSGATSNLDRLVSFMAMYPERTAIIEGHTDSVGDDAYNMSLSLRRADAVRSYLNSRGVSSQRLTSFGKGEAFPVSGNDSSAGRQQNRRVEVIIDNRVAATAAVRP